MDILTRLNRLTPKPVRYTTATLYEVRQYVELSSAPVGFKRRLLPSTSARAVVRFLRARGVDAYAAPMRVARAAIAKARGES